MRRNDVILIILCILTMFVWTGIAIWDLYKGDTVMAFVSMGTVVVFTGLLMLAIKVGKEKANK